MTYILGLDTSTQQTGVVFVLCREGEKPVVIDCEDICGKSTRRVFTTADALDERMAKTREELAVFLGRLVVLPQVGAFEIPAISSRASGSALWMVVGAIRTLTGWRMIPTKYEIAATTVKVVQQTSKIRSKKGATSREKEAVRKQLKSLAVEWAIEALQWPAGVEVTDALADAAGVALAAWEKNKAGIKQKEV